MKGFAKWLIRWGLGEVDSKVLLSEMRESYQEKVEVEGKAAAGRWMRRELRRAAYNAATDRLRRGPRRRGDSSSRPVAPRREGPGSVLRDILFGLRVIRKRPLFSILVIGTLGLGIGASTVVFSLVDGVLLRDLPFRRSGELVNIWKTRPGWRGQEVVGEAWDKLGLTWDEYRTLKERTQLFEEIGVHRARVMTLRGSGDPERLAVGESSPTLFPLLGVRFARGRGFLPEEEGPGSPRVAVLSHPFWESRFGSDPEIVGRTIDLGEETFEVVGVLADDVRIPSTLFGMMNSSLDAGDRALWVPLRFDRMDGSQDHEAVGRLRAGVTLDQVRSELDALIRDGRSEDQLGFRLTPPKEEIVGGYRTTLRLLLAASGILLLIACANTAALLMSEAVDRRHEVATRLALGAGHLRIFRQLLTESVILGLLGSALGLVLATAGTRGLLAMAPPLPRLEGVGMNHSVLFFSILAGLGTGVLFGFAPAVSLPRESIRSIQTAGGRGRIGGGGGVQRGLLAGQLALTLILLVSGGLLARSLFSLSAVDPGFEGAGLATVRVHLSASGFEDSEYARRKFTEILGKVREIPGVEQAGGVNSLPFPGRLTGSGISFRGEEGKEEYLISRDHLITPGYLETMGIPLVQGRFFLDSEAKADGPQVMVINEWLSRRFWPEGSPVGSSIRLNGREYEVVGVAGNIRERHLSEEPDPMAYTVGPEFTTALSIVARSNGEASGLSAEMRRAIWSVDPNVSLSQESTVPALVTSSIGAERYRAFLVIAFGVLATLLSSVGVFGVTAHTVSKRNREMGIRMAMGAEGGTLVRSVVLETLLPGAFGIGVGLTGALVVSRLLEGYLFGIGAWDVRTYLGVLALVGSLGILAAAIPAARAGRVDPVQVLREE